ncbi:hypothetical protein NM688_g4375 [Phlebia brevispora]|uniref:Uncharacterized protein n=1 Tax=Phlebia brevispora TaxID=194682 RepID=A0ACC1T3Q4_9APHY|nr:hypothetical protein NM688_g4375 [Phlebia brevispora]
MITLSLLDFAACGLALILVRWLYIRQTRKRRPNVPHPPGPPGLPIIGNLRDMPKYRGWFTYQRWSREYGSDLIRLNIFGSNIVVVNSLEAALDLLERRSPEMTMLNELCGFAWGLAFQRYGNFWRDARRAFHHDFNPDSVRKFRPVEERAAYQFLRNLLERPLDVMEHLRHMAGSEIMKIAYAIDVKGKDDPYILTAEHAVESISATTNAGSYLVDILPFLKYIPEWFPGAKFQKEARMWRESVMKMLHVPYAVIKQRMADGDMPECAATSLLEGLVKNARDPAYMEDVVMATLGSMYTGGADTTVSALGSFFLAMVLNPDIQVKAQQEIDHALVKESLRWNPVVPLDVPHRSTADDVYSGYFLPKDTLVVANSWSILHDEEVYPDPLTFNPDRFIKDGKMNPEVRDPAAAAFGFGRRICPGRFMAYESMWIAIASTLAVFNITKALGPDGKPITPTGEYEWGFLCYPKPFLLHASPRSPEHEALIRATNTLE